MAPTKPNKEQKVTAATQAVATPPSSPTKAALSPKKAYSPTRKAGGFNCTPVSLGQANEIYEFGIIDVGLGPLYLVTVEKEKGKGTMFNVPSIRRLNDSSEKDKDDVRFLLNFFQRDPNDAEKLLTTTNSKLKDYNHDIFLLTSEYVTPMGKEPSVSDYFVNTSKFTKIFNTLTKEGEDAGDYKYGTPVYVNKGNKTPTGGACLFDFLVLNDCVTVMKCFCDGVDFKTDLMVHDERDEILKLIFGDADKGFDLISTIDDMIYDSL